MEYLSALFLFTISATITPGPNNVMIMTSGLNYGIRKSMPHLLGICFGFPVMVIVVGSGLGVVFQWLPILHTLIKITGIVYLLYLAWLIANSAPTDLNGEKARPFTFMQAALFQWVNPKAWVMATGAIAAFTTADANIYWQSLIIAGVFFIIAFPCVGTWLYFGVALKRVLSSPSHQRWFNVAMAVLLVVSMLPSIIDLIAS
ncbi:MAG: LysE family translocator [Pseudomonadota bacterium]|nr:LysE family translocator [Pseudomonadota bacterium]